jgi:outer membrane protein assembly factor BamB
MSRRDLVMFQGPTGLTAVDSHTGQTVWGHSEECDDIPSPVVSDHVVYLPSDGITALRATWEGNTGRAEVLWRENRLRSDGASPLVHGGCVYCVNRSGVLTCGDAATGQLHWRLRLKGRFWATPLAAGDRLYLVNSDGLAQVVGLGPKGKVIGTGDFGEKILSTPAIADGALYVRSDRHLWKIARPQGGGGGVSEPSIQDDVVP